MQWTLTSIFIRQINLDTKLDTQARSGERNKKYRSQESEDRIQNADQRSVNSAIIYVD